MTSTDKTIIDSAMRLAVSCHKHEKQNKALLGKTQEQIWGDCEKEDEDTEECDCEDEGKDDGKEAEFDKGLGKFATLMDYFAVNRSSGNEHRSLEEIQMLVYLCEARSYYEIMKTMTGLNWKKGELFFECEMLDYYEHNSNLINRVELTKMEEEMASSIQWKWDETIEGCGGSLCLLQKIHNQNIWIGSRRGENIKFTLVNGNGPGEIW